MLIRSDKMAKTRNGILDLGAVIFALIGFVGLCVGTPVAFPVMVGLAAATKSTNLLWDLRDDRRGLLQQKTQPKVQQGRSSK